MDCALRDSNGNERTLNHAPRRFRGDARNGACKRFQLIIFLANLLRVVLMAVPLSSLLFLFMQLQFVSNVADTLPLTCVEGLGLQHKLRRETVERCIRNIRKHSHTSPQSKSFFCGFVDGRNPRKSQASKHPRRLKLFQQLLQRSAAAASGLVGLASSNRRTSGVVAIIAAVSPR